MNLDFDYELNTAFQTFLPSPPKYGIERWKQALEECAEFALFDQDSETPGLELGSIAENNYTASKSRFEIWFQLFDPVWAVRKSAVNYANYELQDIFKTGYKNAWTIWLKEDEEDIVFAIDDYQGLLNALLKLGEQEIETDGISDTLLSFSETKLSKV